LRGNALKTLCGYGMLFDLRGMTGEPTLADLRELMVQASSHRPAERPRGPVALLATEAILYSRLCTYAALARGKLTIEVFRDLDEADRWLATETT
jgi:hypothetical protein